MFSLLQCLKIVFSSCLNPERGDGGGQISILTWNVLGAQTSHVSLHLQVTYFLLSAHDNRMTAMSHNNPLMWIIMR